MESSIAQHGNDYARSARKAISFPLIVICLFLVLMAVWRILDWPTPEESYKLMVRYFSEYGLVAILLGSLGEGIAVVNFYFPGSAVILLGMAASKGLVSQAVMVVLVASVGFAVAAQVNYAIGSTGLYPILYRIGGQRILIENKRRYEEQGAKSLFWWYFHPNIGALVAVAAGMGRLNRQKFTAVTTVAILWWNTLWGVITYMAAGPIQKVATSPYLVLSGLFIWLVLRVGFFMFQTWRLKKQAKIE